MVAKAGTGWRLAPSLVSLIDEVDARWPKRKRALDGSIGDQAHAARTSEHNPDRDPDPMPAGYVSALDITKDSAAQMDAIRQALIADPRTWYVIHNQTIWSRTNGFRPQPYTRPGSNPHTGHLHVSLMQTATGAKPGPWGIRVPARPTPKPPAKTPAQIIAQLRKRVANQKARITALQRRLRAK